MQEMVRLTSELTFKKNSSVLKPIEVVAKRQIGGYFPATSVEKKCWSPIFYSPCIIELSKIPGFSVFYYKEVNLYEKVNSIRFSVGPRDGYGRV